MVLKKGKAKAKSTSTRNSHNSHHSPRSSVAYSVAEEDHNAPFIGTDSNDKATYESCGTQNERSCGTQFVGRRSQERVPRNLDIDKDVHDDGLNLRHVVQITETECDSPKTKKKKGRLQHNNFSSSSSTTYGKASSRHTNATEWTCTPAVRRTGLDIEAAKGGDEEVSELFEPDLVNRTVRHVCYAVDPLFRMETLRAQSSWWFLVYSYFMPLASFLLDVTKVVPEHGTTACHGYIVGRALILLVLTSVTVFFAISNWSIRQGLRTWEPEQYFLLVVLVICTGENAKQLFKLFFEELRVVCGEDFSVQSHADLRFLRVLNFAFNYIVLEVFRKNGVGLAAVFSVTVISVLEIVFLYSYPVSDHDAFIYNAEQWFETVRIFLIAHKAYLAYMHLNKRSYLRTRSRQLGFWVVIGPLAVECFFRICGRQLVNLYNILEEKSITFNSFVGEVCTTELRYIVFAIVFGAPFPSEKRPNTVRMVRSEQSSFQRKTTIPGKLNGEHRLVHRRNNIFVKSFGLESLNRDLEDLSPHSRPTFCLETAIWAFNCSYLVYFDEPSKAFGDKPSRYAMKHEDLRKVDLDVKKFVHHPQTSAYACIFADSYKAHRIFVSFRGTASLTDVKTDIKAWAKEVQFGQDESNTFWIHQGFHSAYKAIGALVRVELHHIVKELLAGGTPPEQIMVVFCGHSLGGAHATLMAVDSVDQLQAQGISNIKVYTYGAPRVGDGQFAEFANSRITEIFRIVGSADPVPRVPGQRTGCLLLCLGLPLCCKLYSYCTKRKKGVLLFYRHVGYEMVINKNNVGDFLADPLAVEYHFFLSWIPKGTDHLFAAYRSGMLAAIFQLKGDEEMRKDTE